MAWTKRQKKIKKKIDRQKIYGADEAFTLVKDCANAKFTESVEAAIRLGVDPRKSDQNVRGSSKLPNGTGKTVRVA
ncbi:MAG: 50S ribosomal protein L1, partial [Coxiellaceae bacterium]|nr:50S ribosomal protein L1 [Coxiellaceae bacterium]